MDKLDVLIVGVGGQGTLLASRVLGKYALEKGYDVKLSEVHGMAQFIQRTDIAVIIFPDFTSP